MIFRITLLLFIITAAIADAAAQSQEKSIRILVIAEREGGVHQPFVDTAKVWLNDFAQTHQLSIDYIADADSVSDHFLSRYQLFIQLNYPPYHWSDSAKKSFEKYIRSGKGGWIGFHHATLLGEFDGFRMWPWFSSFMGGIRFKNYIAGFASGQIITEDNDHPVMKGIPGSFTIEREEFYTYDKSPRPNVHVLAHVDEKSYTPSTDIVMGDHPVVWTNPHVKARNVYIFMGHGPWLFRNTSYKQMLSNAIIWASQK